MVQAAAGPHLHGLHASAVHASAVHASAVHVSAVAQTIAVLTRTIAVLTSTIAVCSTLPIRGTASPHAQSALACEAHLPAARLSIPSSSVIPFSLGMVCMLSYYSVRQPVRQDDAHARARRPVSMLQHGRATAFTSHKMQSHAQKDATTRWQHHTMALCPRKQDTMALCPRKQDTMALCDGNGHTIVTSAGHNGDVGVTSAGHNGDVGGTQWC